MDKLIPSLYFPCIFLARVSKNTSPQHRELIQYKGCLDIDRFALEGENLFLLFHLFFH